VSGSTIGGVVGATIGFFVGSPQLGWMIGSAIGGYVDPDVIEGPRLKDAQVQTSQEGVPRPIIYGTAQVAGNLIHRGPLKEVKKKERTGKGGPVQETYHYYMTYAIRVCEGPVAGIRRIWRDDKLVYSTREGDSLDADTAAFASKLTIYTGSETQLPDPSLEALPAEYNGGVGNVPSYLGTCYVVFENDDLTERRGTIPQYRFEVVSAGVVEPPRSETLWIATGGDGKMQYSYGGTDWKSEPLFTVPATGDCLLYGNGTLVATDSLDSRYSHDLGQTWAACSFSGTTKGQYTGLQGDYVGGVFYAVDGRVAYSANGASFADAAAGGTQGLAVGGRPGLLVSGQNTGTNQGNVNVSTDGFATSTNVVLGGTGRKWQAIGTNGTRVGVGSGDGFFRYTEDGVTWSGTITVSDGGIAAIAADGDTWVCVGGEGLRYSTDGGNTWALKDLGFSFNGRDVKFKDGLFVAVGDTPGGSIPRIVTSTDGVNWTNRAHNFPSVSFARVSSVVPVVCEGIAIPEAPGFYVSEDGSICGYDIGSVTPDDVTLASIVTDLCSRVGITSSQLDVSELTDIVTGFVVARQMPAAEAIRSLQQGYRFDFPEWDLKLRGIKRGGAIKATITDDDLIGDEEEVRAQAVEFPRKLHLLTSDPEANYEAVKETSERLTDNVKAVGETSMELPIIFASADERAQVCDILHKVAWTEAMGRVELELPEEFSYLCPSDCFDFHAKRWRITKTELMDGSLKVEAARDRVSAYTSGATGTANTPTAPVSSVKGPTLFQAMNLPSLRTQDNQPGVYLAATGLLDAWNGCAVYLSVDGGVTEQLVASISGRATMGKLTAAIDADDGTTGQPAIPVWLYNAEELDSITTAQMDAGLNGFAIGSSGVWEVGQFQTATFADPDWELSDALRGELDTVAAAHVADDPFVLLDDNIVFLPIDASFAGKTLIFRAVTNGTVPENNPTFEMVFDPPTYIIDGGGA
jgi:hypothetical protein